MDLRSTGVCDKFNAAVSLAKEQTLKNAQMNSLVDIKYDNVLPSLNEKEEQRSFRCRSPC